MELNTEPTRDDLLKKRIVTILGVWDELRDKYPALFSECHLERELLREAVESYLDDRDAYMARRRISPPNRIMFHKVAGMMAAAICKYRPIQFTGPSTSKRDSLLQNELLALWNGIALCAEPYLKNLDVLKGMVDDEPFTVWKSEFLQLLHLRPDSAQAIIVIFHSMCMKYLPLTVDSSEAGSPSQIDG